MKFFRPFFTDFLWVDSLQWNAWASRQSAAVVDGTPVEHEVLTDRSGDMSRLGILLGKREWGFCAQGEFLESPARSTFTFGFGICAGFRNLTL